MKMIKPKKSKNKVFRYSFNDTMLGVQYSFYKMEVTFRLCKGRTLSVNVTHIRCVTFQRTCSNEQARYYNWQQIFLIIDIRPIVSAIFFTLVYQPNWLKPCEFLITIMQIINDDKHANNYYWFIGIYNYYYFLLYTRFHSSPVEHENLRSKVVLMGNSTKFFKIPFLKCISIFQNHELLEKKNQYQINEKICS